MLDESRTTLQLRGRITGELLQHQPAAAAQHPHKKLGRQRADNAQNRRLQQEPWLILVFFLTFRRPCLASTPAVDASPSTLL